MAQINITPPVKRKPNMKAPLGRGSKRVPSSKPGAPALTKIEEIFIAEYIKKDQNGTRAYKAATGKPYMKDSVAQAAASRMLRNVMVQAGIAAALAAVSQAKYISSEFIIDNLGRLAEGNIGNFVVVQEDGTIRTDFTGVSKEDMYQLSELSIEECYEPGAEVGDPPTLVRKIKFKIADRLSANITLARLGDLYERNKREVSEHMARVLRQLRDNEITAREAAYEFHLLGKPLPEALKIELIKIELAPPSTGESITDEELERRYQAALAEGNRQRTLFLPERKAEVIKMKKDMEAGKRTK